MAAGEVTPEGTLPKKLLQRVVAPDIPLEGVIDLQSDTVTQVQLRKHMFHVDKDTHFYIFLVYPCKKSCPAKSNFVLLVRKLSTNSVLGI